LNITTTGQVFAGTYMPETERRHPENKQLREKINHIQDVSKQLLTLIHHVQKETMASARSGQVVDLPNEALAASLSDAFEGQRSAISRIQQDIRGVVPTIKSAALISDAERAALML
jgi:gas vesicle protein